VYPTPVIGMLGLLDDAALAVTSNFKSEGDVIILLGRTDGHVGGSEYLSVIHGIVAGDAPALSLDDEKRVHTVLIESAREKLLKSAHDCSDGGLAVALAECCIGTSARPVGAEVDVVGEGLRRDFLLFGEDQSRVVVSAAPSNGHTILEVARKHRVPAAVIGRVGGSRLVIGKDIDLLVADLSGAYTHAIGDRMESEESGLF
jgi:phosphoribosylformylglycinamidine (FGAM) synthase-like enzyme